MQNFVNLCRKYGCMPESELRKVIQEERNKKSLVAKF
jgi:hypothetical protein